MLKEDIFYEYTSSYAIRGWPLLNHFNKITMEVMQHGLYDHWESQVNVINKICFDILIFYVNRLLGNISI